MTENSSVNHRYEGGSICVSHSCSGVSVSNSINSVNWNILGNQESQKSGFSTVFLQINYYNDSISSTEPMLLQWVKQMLIY